MSVQGRQGLNSYIMKLTIKELREIIRHTIAGSDPNEAYSHNLLDDRGFQSPSVYVPDDIKQKIKKWADDMMLSSTPKNQKKKKKK